LFTLSINDMASPMKTLMLLAMLLATVAVATASTAEASHILVKDEAKCNELKSQITSASDVFAKFKVRSPACEGSRATRLSVLPHSNSIAWGIVH
jgi:hypothetical protein